MPFYINAYKRLTHKMGDSERLLLHYGPYQNLEYAEVVSAHLVARPDIEGFSITPAPDERVGRDDSSNSDRP